MQALIPRALAEGARGLPPRHRRVADLVGQHRRPPAGMAQFRQRVVVPRGQAFSCTREEVKNDILAIGARGDEEDRPPDNPYNQAVGDRPEFLDDQRLKSKDQRHLIRNHAMLLSKIPEYRDVYCQKHGFNHCTPEFRCTDAAIRQGEREDIIGGGQKSKHRRLRRGKTSKRGRKNRKGSRHTKHRSKVNRHQ